MLFSLIQDLSRQWLATVSMKDRMHHDLPRHFRDDWQDLSWTRYQYFYGVLVPVIIHDALFRLHDVSGQDISKKVTTAQGLVTGLFDDLTDRLHLSGERIRHLIEVPDYIISSDFIEEHLCQYLFKVVHEHFQGNKNLLENSVLGILKAQQMSIQQLNQNLPLDKVLYITRTKGANAVIFYRSCVDQPLTGKEMEFLQYLGGLFQMTNDINDALRDQNTGETTFMTMGLTLREIRGIFEAQIKSTMDSWKELSANIIFKEGLFSRINILLARSLVSLDRYERIADPEKPFRISEIPEKSVVSGLKIPYEFKRWYLHYRRLESNLRNVAR